MVGVVISRFMKLLRSVDMANTGRSSVRSLGAGAKPPWAYAVITGRGSRLQ